VQLFFSNFPISIEGGREKVFVELSNLAIEKNCKVINICNSSDQNEKPFFLLNKEVEFYNLGLGKIKAPFYKKIIREIARIFHLDIENYVDSHKTKILAERVNNILKDRDIYAVICYEFNSIMVANYLNLKMPKIATMHSAIEIELGSKTKKQIMQINKIDAYQVLIPSAVDKVKKYINTKVVCIPNMVSQINANKATKSNKNKKIILNIGRIDRNKRQHILIKAFAKIPDKDKWEVHIYGYEQDKQYKKEMEYFIKRNGLSNKIFFKGVTNEPLKCMQNADIFAFPSAYETFSLALAEAMSTGLPAIGFKETTAVNEWIINNETGFLCENSSEFMEKLEILMKDDKLRKQMGRNSSMRIDGYSPDKVWLKWEKLFNEIYVIV
jgi:glycosyltransferase involved in cell wall biosynthesis